MARFRERYGASPLHLLAVLASFAIAGYGFLRIVQSPSPAGTLIYLGFAVIAHDMLAFPLYSGLNLIAGRGLATRTPSRGGARVPAINHLRIPVYLAAISFLLFFPLILGLDSERYESATGQGTGVYLGRWLALCAVLFLVSAVVYAVRLRLAARREAAGA